MSEVKWPASYDIPQSNALIQIVDYLNDLNERLSKLEREVWWGSLTEKNHD